MTLDLTKLREAAERATPGPWYHPHFADDDHECNCTGIIAESRMGAVAEIWISNDLPISDGGNDCPPIDEAKWNARFIALANPATILALIERVETAEADNKRLRGTLDYIAAQAKQGYPTVLSVILANATATLDDDWQATVRAALSGGGNGQ